MKQIAFLGAGMMASGFIERLLETGHQVTVWNRTPDKARALEKFGATVQTDPSRAVEGAEQIHIMSRDDATVDQLIEQITPVLTASQTVIDHTTVTPAGTTARFARFEQLGIPFLHAPVFMTPANTREAKGVMLVAGRKTHLDHVEVTLKQMSSDLWYLGERPDRAAAFKLAGNMFIFFVLAGMTDIFAFAQGLGIEPSDIHTLFRHFRPDGLIDVRGAQMARGTFSPASFELTMARKDAGLMLETAKQHGVELAVLPAIVEEMDAAIAAGYGSDDVAAIAADVVRKPVTA